MLASKTEGTTCPRKESVNAATSIYFNTVSIFKENG